MEFDLIFEDETYKISGNKQTGIIGVINKATGTGVMPHEIVFYLVEKLNNKLHLVVDNKNLTLENQIMKAELEKIKKGA